MKPIIVLVALSLMGCEKATEPYKQEYKELWDDWGGFSTVNAYKNGGYRNIICEKVVKKANLIEKD